MTREEICQRVHQILSSSDNIGAIRSYSEFEDSLSAEDRIIAGAALDAYSVHRRALSERQVWVLIHGINTEAVWQEHVRSELKPFSNISVECLSFGFFDVLRFAIPIFGRWRPVDKIRDDLREIAVQNPGVRIGVVAHSFGTYVISQVLRKNTDIRLSSLLLCGGIIPRRYPWNKLPNKPAKGYIVNEVGTKDRWPIFAGVISWSYGPSGSFGFKGPHVHDRYFHVGHSEFFKLAHVREFWLPFILRGEIKEGAGDKTRETPSVIWSFLATPWVHIIVGGVCLWQLGSWLLSKLA